jgi:anti-sigma factor RsiW
MIPSDTEQSRLLMHAYSDGELDPVNALEIERRIAADPRLAAEYRQVETFKQLLRERLPREELPRGLQARIEAAVGMNAPSQPSWRSLAASIAVTAMVASGATWVVRGPGADDATRDGIVAGHTRSLMASQPVDVISSDQHTVKPWFNGRLDVAPPVIDLTPQGFTLIGGRLDYIDGRPVAAIVYKRRAHVINLFVSQTAGSGSGASMEKLQGFTVWSWAWSDLSFRAVSDINGEELQEFGDKLKTGVQSGGT